MKILNKIIIIILVLLVLGLYFEYQITKSAIKTTGHVILDESKKVVDKIKESETARNMTEAIKEKIPSIKDDDKWNLNLTDSWKIRLMSIYRHMHSNITNAIKTFWIGLILSAFGLITSTTTVAIVFLNNVKIDTFFSSKLYLSLGIVDFASLFMGMFLTIIGAIDYFVYKRKY